MARAPSRRRACAFLRLWLLLRFSEFKMTAIHGHMGKKSTCTFPKSRNRVEKGGRAKRAPSARRTMVRKMPVISIRSGDRTVAILAQGTSWADAATQAFLQKSLKVKSSSLPRSVFGCLVLLLFGCCPCCAAPIFAIHELCARSLMALLSLAATRQSGLSVPLAPSLQIMRYSAIS
jgi:hypothetical protein